MYAQRLACTPLSGPQRQSVSDWRIPHLQLCDAAGSWSLMTHLSRTKWL